MGGPTSGGDRLNCSETEDLKLDAEDERWTSAADKIPNQATHDCERISELPRTALSGKTSGSHAQCEWKAEEWTAD